jgi:hypothetical protein
MSVLRSRRLAVKAGGNVLENYYNRTISLRHLILIMKNFHAFFISLLALICFIFYPNSNARSKQKFVFEAEAVSPNVVISQFYGGGGLNGAHFTHDFVELFNRGSSPVNLNGWSVQYASANGTQWLVTPLSGIMLQPGQFYLIQYRSCCAAGYKFFRQHIRSESFFDDGKTRSARFSRAASGSGLSGRTVNS